MRTRKNGNLQIITSASGRLEYDARPGFHQLLLNNASIYKRVDDGPDVFAEINEFSLWLPAGTVDDVGYKTKSTSSFELAGASLAEDRAELQWRLSTPLSALLLALLALPLSRARPRQGRYAKLLAALVIYAIYFNLLDVARTWVEQGTARSIWWVPALLTSIVVLLYVPWNRVIRRRLNTEEAPA